MRKPIILLDVDGVVADFAGPFLAKANEITGMSVSPADIRQWDILTAFPDQQHGDILEHTYKPGFCTALPTLPGAVEGVRRLREIGDVYALTSPWTSETWCWERTRWLRDRLDFDKHDVLHVPGNRKHLVRGDVLIDDKLETVVEWTRSNPEGLALLWDAPYNHAGTLTCQSFRVFGWAGALHAVETYGKVSL